MSADIISFDGKIEEPKCSFCKASKSQTKKMVQGIGGKYICNKCIEKCTNLIKASENEKL